MPIEYDIAIDQINQAKHGVSLAIAEELDWECALIRVDDRNDYGEQRYQALGLREGRLYMVVFTVRGAMVRVISMRKANKREERQYEQA